MVVCIIIIAAISTDKVISRINLKFAQLEGEINLNREKLLRLNTILRQAEELNSEYKRLTSGYKEIRDSNSLLQEINNIAKRTNINILNIKPGVIKDKGLYKTYSVRIEVHDEVSSLAMFLHTLTEGLKGINIEQLQLNSQGNGELPKASILISSVAFEI